MKTYQSFILIVVASVLMLLAGQARSQQEYDGMFFVDDETGIMEFIPGPIEIDEIDGPLYRSKVSGGNSGCYKCMDYFCEGKPCRDYDCRRCTGYKYECNKKCPPPPPKCVCDCNCNFDRKCPDCVCNPKLTCGNNTLVSGASRCNLQPIVPQCTTGQGTNEPTVFWTTPSSFSGATIVPASATDRRELIHLIYNGTFCKTSTSAIPARIDFFNDPSSAAIVTKSLSCVSGASTCCVDLCEVSTFTGIDLIRQGTSAALTASTLGGTFVGTITAGTCS